MVGTNSVNSINVNALYNNFHYLTKNTDKKKNLKTDVYCFSVRYNYYSLEIKYHKIACNLYNNRTLYLSKL